MRSVTETLDAAQLAASRYPIARVTVRDVRLRFSQFTQGANPWSITDDAAQVNGEDYVYGASLVLANGTILRAWGSDGNMRLQRITDPADPDQWDHAENAWADLGFEAAENAMPALVQAEDDKVYLFYADGLSMSYRVSDDNGETWSEAFGLGFNHGSTTGQVAMAAVSETEVYSFMAPPGGGYLRLQQHLYDGDGWNTYFMPRRMYASTITPPEWSSITYFDAFKLGGKTWVIYSMGDQGRAWVIPYFNGQWGEARRLMPDDYTKVYPYRATVIQGRVWLTARVKRENAAGFSPAMDVFMYSDDGEHWTALSRESFITSSEIRGKLLLAGDYVYYPGIYTVYRAPATYLIDPAGDPADRKIVLAHDDDGGDYDDILGLSVDFPSAGTAPAFDVKVANGDDGYLKAPKNAVVKPGSDVTVEAGYWTTAGREMVTLLRGNIDQVPSILGNGVRDNSISGRCALFKSLKDWSSFFYDEMVSQLKHFDSCDVMDSLYIMNGGEYVTQSANLIANPGFETSTAGWSDHKTGSATGTRGRSEDEFQSGYFSYKLAKTGGGQTDQWGTQTRFSALAGQTYRVSLFINVTSITGGTEQVQLAASGFWGEGGSLEFVTAEHSGVTDGWEELSVEFTTTVAATIFVTIYFNNCTTGTMYVDSADARQTSLGFIRYTTQDSVGLLFSTSPFDAEDIDIRARVTDAAPTAPASVVEMGIVALASDQFNYVCLIIERGRNKLGLYRVRNGNRTELDAVIGPLGTPLAANTTYDLRLVYRGGHFYCYLKPASQTAWGAPKISKAWNFSDMPCLSDNGRGKIGLLSHIKPLRFRAYGLDQYSRVVCLREDNSLDWSSFPSSGELLWEGERLTYTGKTNATALAAGPVVPDAGPASFCQETAWQVCATDLSNPQCVFSQPPYQWDHYVLVNLAGTEPDKWNNYGLIFPHCGEPYAAWLISDSDKNPQLPSQTALTTDEAASGHSNTFGQLRGTPPFHVFGVPQSEMTVAIAPCLYGVTRGAANTAAIAHSDNSLVYQFADDAVQFEHFIAFDYEHDWCTEDMLRHVCSLAGVFDVEFDDTYPATGDPDSFVVSPAVGQFATPTWLGDFNNKDVDLRFQFASAGWAGSAMAACVVLRSTSTNWASCNALMLEIQSPSAGSNVVLWNRSSGSLKQIESLPMINPPVQSPVDVRVVATGDFITVYCNGVIVASFHTTLYSANASNRVGLTAYSAQVSFSGIRIPDLFEWREAVYVDNDTNGITALNKIIEDRPIRYISRSGQSLKFSSFDVRDNLGAFSDIIFTDSLITSDLDVFSYLRVYAEEIMERVDDELARDYGLVLRVMHMPKASIATAAKMMDRVIRGAKETLTGHSPQVAANLCFENEDRFAVDYTVAGTGLPVEADLIVNGVQYSYSSEPNFVMTVNARRYVE